MRIRPVEDVKRGWPEAERTVPVLVLEPDENGGWSGNGLDAKERTVRLI